MTLLLYHCLKLSRRNSLQRIIMCIDVLDEFFFFPATQVTFSAWFVRETCN